MSFKDISYLELWRSFRPTEWNHLLIFAFLVEGIMRDISVKLFRF